MKMLWIFGMMLVMSAAINAASQTALSNQGTSVRNISSGNLVNGSIEVFIYDNETAGTLIYSEGFTDVILNGNWNIMLGENLTNPLSLNHNQKYWMAYKINGEAASFTNLTGGSVGRLFFYSPVGSINWSNLTGLPVLLGTSENATLNTAVANTSSLASTKAQAGTCGAGTAVQNATATGVQCAPFGGTDYTANISMLTANTSADSARLTFINNSINATIATKAGTGTATCPAGTVAENVTTSTSGITTQCAPSSGTDYSGNISSLTSNVSKLMFNSTSYVANISSIYASLQAVIFNASGSIANISALTANTSVLMANSSGYLNNISVLSATKANIGTCASGLLVQNTTLTGVQCIEASTALEVDPRWTANYSTFLTIISNTSTYLTNMSALTAAQTQTDGRLTVANNSLNGSLGIIISNMSNQWANQNTNNSIFNFSIMSSISNTSTYLTNMSAITVNISVLMTNSTAYVKNLSDTAYLAAGWQRTISNISTALNVSFISGFSLNTTLAKPTCNAAYRGQFWVDQGGAGVTDLLYICMKNSSDSFNYALIMRGD